MTGCVLVLVPIGCHVGLDKPIFVLVQTLVVSVGTSTTTNLCTRPTWQPIFVLDNMTTSGCHVGPTVQPIFVLNQHDVGLVQPIFVLVPTRQLIVLVLNQTTTNLLY